MKYSFRWYGPKDPVKLTDIRQSNANYIVTSLHQIPTGEKWGFTDVENRINLINKSNNDYANKLKWNVVESIPVHNDIKLRKNNFKKYIANYKDTIVNIAKNKIPIICYNFMPIIDWTRTQLDFKLPTDGLALRFSFIHIIIFEKYILNLDDLENRYSHDLLSEASQQYKMMTNNDLDNLKFSVMGGLPAAEKKYTIEEFKEMLLSYKNIDNDELKNNFSEFLKEIIPVAEENNIKMALHPDDPPISLFGLPRIVSNQKDYQFVLDQYKSHNNGITFCTGSLGSNINNNIYEMFNHFKDKIHFIHLRNIKIEKDNISFMESDHLEGDINFVKIINMILNEEKIRKNNTEDYEIPMRPDHGHCLLDDQNKKLNPGYSCIGRMKGLAEIRGIIQSINMGHFN